VVGFKEGKVKIISLLTFSSSSEEEYPDRSVRGRWWVSRRGKLR
jgi:hypothetical protein